MTDYRTEILKLEEQILKLKKEQAALESLPLDQQLAIRLHSIQCCLNHTDGCGWDYEGGKNNTNWDGYSHKEYLTKARRIIGKCTEHGINPSIFVDLLVAAK